MSFEWPTTGDRVCGDYLGRAFQGVVTGVGRAARSAAESSNTNSHGE